MTRGGFRRRSEKPTTSNVGYRGKGRTSKRARSTAQEMARSSLKLRWRAAAGALTRSALLCGLRGSPAAAAAPVFVERLPAPPPTGRGGGAALAQTKWKGVMLPRQLKGAARDSRPLFCR